MKVKVISLPYIFQVLYVLCFTRPRYQVSVYRTIGPLKTIRGHGGHLDHVTKTNFINLHPLFPGRHHLKLDLIGQTVSEKMIENNGHIHVYSPRAGTGKHYQFGYLLQVFATKSLCKSSKYGKTRNLSNQNPNTALKTKTGTN